MTECGNREAIRATEEAYIQTEEEASTSGSEEKDAIQRMPLAPTQKKKFSKQLSMCKSRQDIAWEKRRSQIIRQERRKSSADDITDEDMKELKGFMDLGFRFSEEDGLRLGSTLPALDLYLAVNRQVCQSPVSTPQSARTSPASSFAGSPTRDDHWKICNPGDDPKQVKNKLRQWAQVVAFSVMHSH
ncbi:unnamed protein product [Rhodiola kirilowii]